MRRFSTHIAHRDCLSFKIGSKIISKGSRNVSHDNSSDSEYSFKVYVELEDEDTSVVRKVYSVTFILPNTFYPKAITKTLPPFAHRGTADRPINIQIVICLEDGSTHTFDHAVDVKNVDNFTLVQCGLNPDANIKPIQPSELSDRTYYVELDLVVPYPHSRNSHCSPHKLTTYLQNRSEMRCIFTGFYPDENSPTGGHQEMPKDFTGRKVAMKYTPVATSVQEKRASKRSPSLRPRWSIGSSRSESTAGIPKPEMFDSMPWTLSFDSREPTNISGSDTSALYTIRSPEIRGFAGLEMIFSMMIAISNAGTDMKLKRRPGFRIGILVTDLEFPQIRKITQQYFKFEDIIENFVPNFKPTSAWESDRVHMNGEDIRARNEETDLYRTNAVDEVVKKRVCIHTLLEKCKNVSDLIQLTCPYQSRFYRYSLRKLRSQGYLEIRLSKHRANFHFVSCCVQLFLRFVACSVVAKPPKKFSKKSSLGKDVTAREEKFFEWLIKDRYLRDEFIALQKQNYFGTQDAANLTTLRLLSSSPQAQAATSKLANMWASPEDIRVDARRRGIMISNRALGSGTYDDDESDKSIHQPISVSINSTGHVLGITESQLQPTSPAGYISTESRKWSLRRYSHQSEQQCSNGSPTQSSDRKLCVTFAEVGKDL